MRRGTLAKRVVLALLFLLWSGAILADHFPESRIARGPSESVLAGINVYHSTLSSLLKSLGRPASLKKYPEVEDSAEAVWTKDGSRIHANINVDDIAFAVDLSGPPRTAAKTGRGLALGASLQDAVRIYGNRFMRHGDDVTFQWRDETELRLHLTAGSITSMTLLTSDE